MRDLKISHFTINIDAKSAAFCIIALSSISAIIILCASQYHKAIDAVISATNIASATEGQESFGHSHG